MLKLIFANGDEMGLVEQYVRSLENWIVQKADINIIAMLFRLVLELRHPFQLSNGGNAIENPGQFRVFRDMGLYKEGTSIRIQPTTDVDNGRLHDSRLHHMGIEVDGNGVVIDDTVDTIIVIDQRDPVLDSPEIVTDMDFPRWLNAAENPLHRITPWRKKAMG
jgi:hypothetical protein